MNRTGNRKPLLMVFAVFIVILILTGAAAFLIRGRGLRRFRSAADAPYPYAWTENSLITLTLDSADASDGVWTTDTEGGGTVVIEIGEAENGKTEVTLRPITEGRAEVVFTLTDGENRLAEAYFMVEAEQDERGGLRATVTEHSEEAVSQGVSGGEDTGYPFNVKTDDFSGAVIHITDPAVEVETYEIPVESADETGEETGEAAGDESVEDGYIPEEYDYIPDEILDGVENEIPEETEEPLWTAYTSDEMVVDVLAVLFEEGGVNIYLMGSAIGSADVSVSKEEADLTYVFSFDFDGMNLILKNTRTAKYTPPPTPYPAPEEDEFIPDGEAELYYDETSETDELYHEEAAVTDEWMSDETGAALE